MKRILIISLLTIIIGCNENIKIEVSEDEQDVKHGVAVLNPLNNSSVTGIVYFDEGDGFIDVAADINGLNSGNHGFHIYQFGDLRSDKGKYIGEVFHLVNKKLSENPSEKGRLLGDLGNVYAVSDTMAYFNQKFFGLSLDGKNAILGKSIVVFSEDDDISIENKKNTSMPIAAGVIGIRNHEAY